MRLAGWRRPTSEARGRHDQRREPRHAAGSPRGGVADAAVDREGAAGRLAARSEARKSTGRCAPAGSRPPRTRALPASRASGCRRRCGRRSRPSRADRLGASGHRPQELGPVRDLHAEAHPACRHCRTSSARASTDCGIVTPSAFAVLRLMSSSNLVGCSTGRSAGLTPFRILSTKVAARRPISVQFAP